MVLHRYNESPGILRCLCRQFKASGMSWQGLQQAVSYANDKAAASLNDNYNAFHHILTAIVSSRLSYGRKWLFPTIAS